jgi:DNA-binding LacI/PurR family transcriptional regulator
MKADDRALGYIFWSNALSYDRVNLLLHELGPTGKPLAVIDEIGDFELPSTLADSRLIKIFTIAAAVAGREVARFLLNLGHRHVAFISPVHQQQWAQKRFDGIVQTFRNAGISFRQPAAQVPSQPGSLHCFAGNGAGKTSDVDPEVVSLVNNVQACLHRQSAQRMYFGEFASHLGWYLLQTLTLEQQRVGMQPLFEEAISHPEITAWVGANDHTALFAIHFLKTHGIIPPERISVIGFDDIRMAYDYNMSTYNFNLASMAQRTVSYILNPNHEHFWNKLRIECEGKVIERKTTGRIEPR